MQRRFAGAFVGEGCDLTCRSQPSLPMRFLIAKLARQPTTIGTYLRLGPRRRSLALRQPRRWVFSFRVCILLSKRPRGDPPARLARAMKRDREDPAVEPWSICSRCNSRLTGSAWKNMSTLPGLPCLRAGMFTRCPPLSRATVTSTNVTRSAVGRRTAVAVNAAPVRAV